MNKSLRCLLWLGLTSSVSITCLAEYDLESRNEVVAEIDRQISEVWRQYEMQPSREATDGEWCRRIYLDVIGRIPNVDELQQFLRNRSADKRRDLVNRLLTGSEYREAYAGHWGTVWTNLLIGRTGGTRDRDLNDRAGALIYLRDSFAENKPYDQLTRELIAATGTTRPDAPNFHGATNFLADKLDDKATQATARTSQIFLGVQVQCTQCHDHPFNDWKQNQFWELNAFFRQTRALRRFEDQSRNIRFVELTDEDFGGEGNTPESAEIYYERRNGILKAAYPVFIDGQGLSSQSGYLRDVNRRERLAAFVVASDYLAVAMVNRTWAYFLGHGFTQPVDDMGPHNPASHPELLAYLADQFREQRYDMKALMRWILLSEAYSLSSRANHSNEQDDPQLGQSPKFSRFYLRQLLPEQLYESLLVATEAHKTRETDAEQQRAKSRWLGQFNRAFGNDEGGDTTTFNGSIPQALELFNGELIREATGVEGGSFLARVAKSKQPAKKKIEYLYLAALARKPNSAELKLASQLVASRAFEATKTTARRRTGETLRYPGDHGESTQAGKPHGKDQVDPISGALQDIWWALLNSNEFILNH